MIWTQSQDPHKRRLAVPAFFNVGLMPEPFDWRGFGRIFHFSGVSTTATVLYRIFI
jgi:hypothetical protein